jgi:hypothetical protein
MPIVGRDDVRDSLRAQSRSDQQVEDILHSARSPRARTTELAKVDLEYLSPAVRSKVAELLSQQLRGQIPPSLAKQLNDGSADPALLSQLVGRLANAWSGKTAVAVDAESARAQAADPTLPQQALRWARFVQRPLNVAGGGVEGRAGSAAPKGQMATLAELIAGKMSLGPGLRSPHLVQKAFQALSPEQRAMVMERTFGRQLAASLQEAGVTDPFMFIKAGALPRDRADLARAMGIPRGQLLGLLLRAELLTIGPGRNGELAIRPENLGALREAGIAMLATLGALRGLTYDDLREIYRRFRARAAGIRKTLAGQRGPVQRDLLYWARTAARRKSEILLADSEQFEGRMTRDDAAELVQAWYLEHLLWERLEHERKERGDDDDETRPWFEEELVPAVEADEERPDELMCFWVSDHMMGDPGKKGGMRHMYICVDPKSGAILPQHIEREEVPL